MQHVRKTRRQVGTKEEKEIHELLEEMESEAGDMAFEEHTFFQQEFLQNLNKEFSYDTHRKQFQDTHEKIDQTLEILKETRYLERQIDEMMQQREQIGKKLDQEERHFTEQGKRCLCKLGVNGRRRFIIGIRTTRSWYWKRYRWKVFPILLIPTR